MNGILDDHLQKIEDFVLVEDRIVTYKWISKALKVHINTAKQLLYAFTLKEEFRKKILVTYLIGGKGEDNFSQKFCLVLQNELDKVKQSIGDIISQHVYSIQRNTNFNAKELYNADCTYELNEEDKKFCSIQKNEDIVKRIAGEPLVPSVDSSKTCQNSIQNSLENNSKRNIAEVNSSNNDPKIKESNTTKYIENSSPKKEISKSSPSKSAAPRNKKSPKKLKNTVTKGLSIGALFSKQMTNASNKKQDVATVKEDIEKEETKENLGEINGTSESKTNSELDDSIIISTPVRDQSRQINKKRKKKNKNYEIANKRRKRIVVVSDSESCDSDVDMEEYREPTPEPIEEESQTVLKESDGEEIIPPTPIEKGKRKRITKSIDKTYTNDEGYLVTEKKDICESATDDESPPEILKKSDDNGRLFKENYDKKSDNEEKANILLDEQKKCSPEQNKDSKSNKKSKKKHASPKKPQQLRKQQQTIMNFFKKK